MLAQVVRRTRHNKTLTDGHVRRIEHVNIIAALGGSACRLIGARGHRRVGDVEDLRLGMLCMDAVEHLRKVTRSASARLGQNAQLATFFKHLCRVKGAVIDCAVANRNVHGHKFDTKLRSLSHRTIRDGSVHDKAFAPQSIPATMRGVAQHTRGTPTSSQVRIIVGPGPCIGYALFPTFGRREE